jgi:hypothetical protein
MWIAWSELRVVELAGSPCPVRRERTVINVTLTSQIMSLPGGPAFTWEETAPSGCRSFIE